MFRIQALRRRKAVCLPTSQIANGVFRGVARASDSLDPSRERSYTFGPYSPSSARWATQRLPVWDLSSRNRGPSDCIACPEAAPSATTRINV